MIIEYSKAETQNPRRLFLYSHTKVGKTTLLSGLENCLIIDTEDGSSFIDGIKLNVLNKLVDLNAGKDVKLSPADIIFSLANKIKSSGEKYKYIAIDTATGLENFARQLATKMYKETNMGKAYKGFDVVADLPNGAGYDWLRKAFQSLYEAFNGCYTDALLLMGHIKNASINKDGKELSAQDISLTGKLKQITCADSDAIGYLYRSKENPNQVIVSFKTNVQDLATGARSPHLRNQEFVISELIDDKFTFSWNKIFKEG
jgi:hypothetical protein